MLSWSKCVRVKETRAEVHSGHSSVRCFWTGEVGTGPASVVFSYLRVDLKDIALCGERRRESCEPLPDGQPRR